MKKVNLLFINHPGKFRLAYHKGESGVFDQKQADELIKSGVCIPFDSKESDLPEDLPGRNLILKAEITFEELKKIEDVTAIKGITKTIAEKLNTYLKNLE